MRKIIFAIFFIISFVQIFSQTKTNLEIIENLLDRSLKNVDSLFENDSRKIFFEFNSPPSYSIFKLRLLSNLSSKGIEILTVKSNPSASYQYSLFNIGVRYNNPFKKGFFGDLAVEREVFIDGASSYMNKDGKIYPHNFNYLYKDSVDVDELSELENNNYEFTKSSVPEPSLFSNLLEPILVAGTLIITVVLFFVIRSK